jgi:hypothetical protein
MKNLFELGAVREVMTRIEQLKPSAQRQWGKMDLATNLPEAIRESCVTRCL